MNKISISDIPGYLKNILAECSEYIESAYIIGSKAIDININNSNKLSDLDLFIIVKNLLKGLKYINVKLRETFQNLQNNTDIFIIKPGWMKSPIIISENINKKNILNNITYITSIHLLVLDANDIYNNIAFGYPDYVLHSFALKRNLIYGSDLLEKYVNLRFNVKDLISQFKFFLSVNKTIIIESWIEYLASNNPLTFYINLREITKKILFKLAFTLNMINHNLNNIFAGNTYNQLNSVKNILINNNLDYTIFEKIITSRSKIEVPELEIFLLNILELHKITKKYIDKADKKVPMNLLI